MAWGLSRDISSRELDCLLSAALTQFNSSHGVRRSRVMTSIVIGWLDSMLTSSGTRT
jgi:hypothetical protein